MANEQHSRYLDYLPTIFHETPADGETERIPLAEYLAPFELELDTFDRLHATLDRYFSPELATAGDFLPWLATWVDLLLDEWWDEDQRRNLIQEAVELYRWRGTVRGLRRYLDIYARVAEEQVEIEEGRWPAGMQIGVASRIGGAKPAAAGDTVQLTMPEVAKDDYYVVRTVTPTEHPPGSELPPLPDGALITLYYRADWVDRVEIEENGVRVHYRPPPEQAAVALFHENPDQTDPDESFSPNVTRRSELIDYRYRRVQQSDNDERNNGSGQHAVEYRGGSYLVETIPSAYRFIVHLELPDSVAEEGSGRGDTLTSVREVLNLEKPAHTDYYLKRLPARPASVLDQMQIEVRSSIGLDTAIGSTPPERREYEQS